MNPVREKTEYLLTKGYFALLRHCPRPVIYGACRGVAALFYALAAKRRRITSANLGIAFPDLPAKDKKRIARAAYDHFGQIIAESTMILAGKIKQAPVLAAACRVGKTNRSLPVSWDLREISRKA